MYIFVDESGTFALTDKKNAWCSIAAFVLPESKRRPLDSLISDLRYRYGAGCEVKLGSIPEEAYVKFLTDLRKLGGVSFAIAADIGLHRREALQYHQKMQAQSVTQNLEKMFYEEGRRAVAELAEDIKALPLQLYTQLILQVELVHTVLRYAPLYYAQRVPVALAHFRWRVDQKDRVPQRYESAFRRMLPGLLQTKALRDPMIFLHGADYRHIKKFEYAPGTAPTYLKDTYGLKFDASDKNCVNLGRMINDDFVYVDSQKSSGVQVADLIASGIRRVLRSNFDFPEKVALALGMNMLEAARGETTVRLLSLDQSGQVDEKVAGLIHLMGKSARPMLVS